MDLNLKITVNYTDGQFYTKPIPTFPLPTPPQPFIHQLIEEAERLWGVPSGTVKSRQRSRTACEPRFAVAYAARRMTKRSYPDIGRIMGGFDHSSIIYAERRAVALRGEDAIFASLLAQLMRNVRFARRAA